MRFTRYQKIDTTGRKVPMVTVHLDCSHAITYSGSIDEAEHKLRQEGGTISRGAVTRCAPCSRIFAETLYNTLKEMGDPA